MKFIHLPDGRVAQVDDNVTTEDVYTYMGFPVEPTGPLPPPPEGEGYKDSLLPGIKRFGGRLLQSVGSALSGEAENAVETATSMGPASQLVGRLAGTGALQTAAENLGMGLQDIGYGIQQRNPQTGSTTYTEALEKGDFGHYLRNQALDLGLFVGEVGGLTALTKNPLAAMALVTAQNTGDILQQQSWEGISDPERALTVGALSAIPDVALGIGGRFTGAVDRAIGEGFWRGAGRTAVEEAITEPAQQLAQRYGSYQDLMSPEALAEYKEAAVVGGVAGGLFGMLPGRRGQSPIVSDQPGQPTDLMDAQLALPAPPLRLPGPGTDFTMTGGPRTPGPAVNVPAPGQLALPAPEQTPLLTASSPFAQAAPGTQMGLPLQGGVSNQQMPLPMNMPERMPPGQQQLPMPMPQMEAPAAPSTWREPELPLGQGTPPPPAGPLFRAPERPAPPPAPEPVQMELPGVPQTVLHSPDVARAMIGGSGRQVQSKKWLDALTDRVTGLAQRGDVRGIASEIDMRRREVEDASNRTKNPISTETTEWRMAALDRADNWLTHLTNAAPEAAPRAPAETLAQPEPEQLPLPFGSTAQPEAQLGLPMLTPERPGMSRTMPSMPGVGEAPSGPRGRLPEIDAWREPGLPFERGYRPPTPRGEAGPLFEEPTPAPPRAPPAERQLSLMTKREMDAPAREKRAKARAAAQATRDRLAREKAERVAAKEAKAAEVENARLKKENEETKAKLKAAEAKAKLQGAFRTQPAEVEAEAPAPAAKAPEPAPVPPPTPQPKVEAKAPARKVNALRKQVAAAKEEADARERSSPLRSAAIELRDEGVIDDAELKAFAQTQRETSDHETLAKVLTDHIDRWAKEAKAAPAAAAAPAESPSTSGPAPTPTRPTKAPVGAATTETVTPSGPVEEAIAELAEKPKTERLKLGEARTFIDGTLTADADLLTAGQKLMIANEASRPEPNFDKLRAYGAKKFAGPKAAAWARVVDGVEKLQQARTEKTTARAPTKRGSTGPRAKVEEAVEYIKELGANVLQRGAVFLRGANIDSPTAYPDSGKRAKARERVTRLRQDRNHFASAMGLGTAQARRLNSGVEAYLAEVPPGNSDAWTNHGWNLGHLYQYGWYMPRPNPDVVATLIPINRETISAHLATYFDTLEQMQAESGINAAAAGLAIPTSTGARAGAAWYYERALQNRYFLDAKAQAEEAAARARAARGQADAATAAGKLPKRGRGRPRKDGLGPGGLAMRIELDEKQATDFTRRGFLQGISAAALVSVANPVIAKPSVPTSTAKHPDLVRLLQAGKPKEALQWVASNSGSKHYRWLAKALMKGHGGFDSLTMQTDPYLADNKNAAGLTVVKDGRTEVTLDTTHGLDEDTFLHEMIHVYVYERWGVLSSYLPSNKRLLGDTVERGDAAVAEFQKLWQRIEAGMVNALDLNSDAGADKASVAQMEFATSIDEALAWMLIDDKLRGYLRSVDIDGKPVGDGKSAWRDILNWFLKALGLDTVADPQLVTALDTMMSATHNLFASGATVKPDLAFYTALEKALDKQNSGEMNEKLNTVGRTNMDGLSMMIGPNGAGGTTDGYASLTKAKAMEFEGGEPHFGSEIRQETGWFKTHASGPWTFEITDHDMTIRQPHRMKEGHAGITTLGRLIDHPQLFAAYPELKDLRVEFDPAPDEPYAGYYVPMENRAKAMSAGKNRTNAITISTKEEGTNHFEFAGVLLHEMQHAVQDLEGLIVKKPPFTYLLGKHTGVLSRLNEVANSMRISTHAGVAAKGADLASRLDTITGMVDEARDLHKNGYITEAMVKLTDVNEMAENDPYIKGALYEIQWIEMQARQTQQRRNMTAEERTQQNPNAELIFGVGGQPRLISGGFSEGGPLGKALSLKGSYPVPNSEADPETTQMSDTLRGLQVKGRERPATGKLGVIERLSLGGKVPGTTHSVRYTSEDGKQVRANLWVPEGSRTATITVFGQGEGTIGPRAMREMRAHVAARFPEIDRIEGERVGGASKGQGRVAGAPLGALSAEQRELAAQLAPLVEGVELRSGTGELAEGDRGRVTVNEDGTVDAQVGHHDDVEAVLHEALHTATVRRWGELKAKMKTGDKVVDDIVNRLEKLRKEAAKLYDAKRDAPEVGEALENIDEFLAYGRTSPAVQEWMRNKRTGGMWGSFVDTVRRILGLSPKYGPLLNSMMRESTSLLDAAARTAPLTAEALAEKIKSGDPVQLMLRRARTKVSSNPIHELNEMSKPWVMGLGNLAKTKLPSYLAIRGDLYDMLSRRMERAGISSDPIKKLARVIASRDAIRVRGEQEVANLNRDYLHLPEGERRGVAKGDKGKVNSLVEAMTRAGEWGFTPDWLSAADTARVKVNPELASRFNALSTPGQKHVKNLLKSIYDKTQQLRAVATEVVRDAYAPDLAAAKTDVERQAVENKIAAETKQVLDPANFDNSLPYAPLRRSGEWAVVAMSKEFSDAKKANNQKRVAELKGDHLHYFVDFAQTEAEAEHMRRAITKANPAFSADKGGIATRKEAGGTHEFYAGGDMPQAFERVMARISGDETMKAGIRNQLQNIARQLYLRSLSDQNARKGALRRFNVASMPLDIQLNVEQHLKSQSYNLASIQRNGEILDSFTALDKAMDKLEAKPDDYADTSIMLNEIRKRYMNTLQPPPEGPVSRTLEKVRSLASFWQLSLSPGFLVQQVLQPTMMTAPLLEARYGLARGAAALKNAYKAVDMGKLSAAWRDDAGLHTNLVAAKYRPLMDYIADMGLLDVGISAETGKLPSRVDEKIKGVRLAREWPRYIEFLNRASSAIAAYEMEMQTPTEVSKPDAGAYADYRATVEGPAMSERQFSAAFAAARMVQQTQGDYSTASAPRMFQSPVGATVAQYRKIAIIVVSNYMRMISRMADKSLSKTERAIAARSLAYSLGHTLVFGGMAGLPGASLVFGLVNMIMGMFGDDDDPPPDIEEDIRKAIDDPMLSNLLLAGVPTMGGLNLSSMLGQGKLISLQPYQDLSLQKDDLLKYVGAMAGPAAGLGINVLVGAGEMIDGNMYKGIAMTMPRGISSTISAYGEAQYGVTNKRGTLLQSPDEIDMTDSVMRAMGLQTEERAGTFERGDRAYDVRTFFKGRQDDITAEYNAAIGSGDSAAQQMAIQKWTKLQQVKQENGFKITPLSSLLTSPARKAKERAAVLGGVRYMPGEEAFAEDQLGLYSDEEQAASGGY